MAAFNSRTAFLLDDVLAEYIEAYFYYGADEDDRRTLNRLLASIARWVDKRGAGDTQGSQERAEARAGVLKDASAVADSSLCMQALLSGPLHAEDARGGVRTLEPAGCDTLDGKVLERFLWECDPQSREAKAEAVVQAYAGNLLRPSLFGAVGAWYVDASVSVRATFVKMMRRVSAALLASPLRDNFPWRPTLYAAFTSDAEVASLALLDVDDDGSSVGEEEAATAHAREMAALDAILDNEQQAGGLSTSKISQQRFGAGTGRFDAHGQSSLSVEQLADLRDQGKIVPAASEYQLAFTFAQEQAAQTRTSRPEICTQRHTLKTLGYDRSTRMVTTYGEDIEERAAQLLKESQERQRKRQMQ